MMFAVLVAAAGVLAALPAVIQRAGRRLPPAEWAVLCLVALAGAAVLVEAAMLMWAAPVVFSALGLDALAAGCADILGPLATVGRWPGAVAAGAAVALAVAGVHHWRRVGDRSAALWIEPGLGRREPGVGFELVVLPTDEALAYCVARPSAQVVVSEGLVRRLSPDQLAAVVAHERAHLECRHGTMLRLAATATTVLAWWPLVRGSHMVLRSAIEQWADDVATDGDGRWRRALRTALIDLAMLEPPQGVAALSLADATAHRVEALDGRVPAAPAMRLGVYLPGLVVGATVTVALISCAALIA